MRVLRRLLRRHRRLSRAELEKRYDLNQLQKFEAVLNRHGRSFSQSGSILEFGCGAGRLTRYLPMLTPGARIFGCDVVDSAMAVCRRRCRQGLFITNDPTPPLPFRDEQFDLIFSYSVFTHLTEADHAAWLRELARVLRPGGVMLHTTHSSEFVRRAATFSPDSLAKYRLPEPVEASLRSDRGFHYVIDNPLRPNYGLTIIGKEYVVANWPRYSGLRLADYVDGGIEAYPEGCQDLVMLAKDEAVGQSSTSN